jgi:hypothetical protein
LWRRAGRADLGLITRLTVLLFGATYFFSEFGPNTTTFAYPPILL